MLDIMGVKYISTKEATKRYGCSLSWLEKQRSKKIGPPYIKLLGKGRTLYPVDKTDEWFKKALQIREDNQL